METNRKLFSHWEGSRFNDYLDKMKVEGTWGNHIELSAYSKLACIDIDINKDLVILAILAILPKFSEIPDFL